MCGKTIDRHFYLIMLTKALLQQSVSSGLQITFSQTGVKAWVCLPPTCA